MCMCLQINTHPEIHTCTHHTYTYRYKHKHTYTRMHMDPHACAHTYQHIYIHTLHIHSTHMDTHTAELGEGRSVRVYQMHRSIIMDARAGG